MNPILSAVIVTAVTLVICLGIAGVAHVVFTEGAEIRRAKRDANLAALRQMGQDRNRPMDISR